MQWYMVTQTIRYIDYDESNSDKKFWVKMLPCAAFLGILWSFTPLIYVFLSAVSEVFYGASVAGYVVIMIFSSIFTCTWI